ncbi:MAG TPA: AAA family ATPase [Candidatus Acidoferrum sp.]|nr:AAA family ATPase [Candidatus Acidoferrum sp.]
MPPKLPNGWVKTTLGEVCAFNPRARFLKPLPDDTEVSFVPMAAVEEESGRLDASQVRALGSVRRGYTPFRENDVIFAKITPCMENGKIALATGLKNGIAYGSTEFLVFRPYKGILPRFVLHFLLQPPFREAAEKQMSGASGQKRVPAIYLFNHEFWLPPTHEQDRIVAKLDAALSGVERAEKASRRAQDRLKRYRAAVLNAAATGELTRAWREAQRQDQKANTETAHDLLRRILAVRRSLWEESELQRLTSEGKQQRDDKWKSRYVEPNKLDTAGLANAPASWMWARLQQLGFIVGGLTKNPRRMRLRLKLPYLRVGNVYANELRLDNVSRIGVDRAELRKLLLVKGDLLIVEGNGSKDQIGRVAIWDGSIKRCVHQNHIIKVRLAEKQLGIWILSWLLSPLGRHHIEKVASSTTGLYTLSINKVGDLPIPLPPSAEQREIVREVGRRLTAADRLSATLDRQLARAHATRRSLMGEAFTGRLVPQDPRDELASLLLERIRTENAQAETEPSEVGQERQSEKGSKGVAMRQTPPSPEMLRAAWQQIGNKTDARRLFDEAGFAPDQVVQFYEALRATPELQEAFQEAAKKTQPQKEQVSHGRVEHRQSSGRFRLVELWLEDFKNLKDYEVRFNPAQGLDVVLGWNGTGKSNLFEALIIILRDLNEWSEKNRWPDKPMNGFRLSYEMDEHTVEIIWRPGQMKRPELKRGPILRKVKGEAKLESIKREELPLPRFVFGYYSGPTNRLAEHFLPMKQDHYDRLRLAKADDAKTLARLLEQRRFFCAETHHAKYVLLGFSYKEDPKISEFLENRLRIVGFESALFIIRRPDWAKSGSKAEDFWGATGIMRRVMERLRRYAIAPMVLQQKVNYGYRSTTEDHYYFFLPDLKSLHSFAAEYQDARTFFLALESTDFSELIHDVKIQVRVKSTNTQQVSITFHQLSEGEQQLLMVLGLMRFTKSHQSLVLLDEPDTHLNPHWSVDYIKDLARVMSDNAIESTEQQTSQILMATHDPLVIASLLKEQIHLLKRDTQTGACKWEPATVNPRGLGFTGILTSEMFGFRSDLDPETLGDLDNRVRLIAKEEALTPQQKKELEEIDKRLAEAGFSKAFSDPYYAAFVRAWGRRHSQLMAGQQFLTPEKRQEIDRIASEVLTEAVAEVDKGAGN